MPELPEVETIRRILLPIVKGKTIDKIRIFYSRCILNKPDEFTKSLEGETFLDLTREGKFLIFHLTHDKAVISHLRMEGKYFEAKANEAPQKHDIMQYDFKDGSGLRYNDVRKFGILKLVEEKHLHDEPPLSNLGEEPFTITPQKLYAGLQMKHHEMIKEALLDQTLMCGLGNIYDDEVLFATRINPKTPANIVTLEQCASIIKESVRILKEAIANGGSTIRSYHPKEGVSGNMQNHLLAYGHGLEPCPRCHFPLRKISIGGRGTVYCPICAPLSSSPLIVGVTGPIASGKSTVSSYLEKKGYYHIDADKMIHELYKEKEVQEAVIALLGNEAYLEGTLNSAFISESIVKDSSKKQALEEILYPRLYKKIHEITPTLKGRVIYDVPLLLGSPLEEECDLIIALKVEEKVQRARLVARGKDPAIALELNKKWPKGVAKKKAGLLLDGNGSVQDLVAQLDKATYL